ncbi:MAG TPA: M23 family peptidase, partial [Bradyrhizobium sp.]|nr:M23 family peptidase [Bradyrhizobium sp.]
MSNRTGHYSDHTQHHHQHDHGRASARRPSENRAAASATQAVEQGYTLVHAGKQVRFGPVVFWIVVGTVIMLGMWSAATATYF